MPADAPALDKPSRRRYPLHQCALYKVSSKGRLASLLGIAKVADLFRLAEWQKNYKVFLKAEDICQFTGKKTKERWVQEPKEELKNVQKRIQKLLARVAAPYYVHGGLAGRSYRSNARAHTAGIRCATFDFESFFPSTSWSQAFHFFKDVLLCEADIAKVLADLCCHDGKLPTGAPTSPILAHYANLALFEALAEFAESHNLVFTAYVDDITFSGDSIPRGICAVVGSLVRKHGHKLSTRKTKQFSRGQPRHVTGVVIHEGRLKVPHSRFLKITAIERAIRSATSTAERLQLTNRLVGLVGEAAYLDDRFKAKALLVYASAERLRHQLAQESV